MATKRPFFYGWMILAISFLTIVAGLVSRNTFSVFYPVIVEEFGWTRGNTALIFSVNILFYGLFAPIAGAMADRFRPRYVLAAGALLIGIGMAGCSMPLRSGSSTCSTVSLPQWDSVWPGGRRL